MESFGAPWPAMREGQRVRERDRAHDESASVVVAVPSTAISTFGVAVIEPYRRQNSALDQDVMAVGARPNRQAFGHSG